MDLSNRAFLVVEDEMMILLDIEDMLVDLGCRLIMRAATVPCALKLLSTSTFQGAVLDVNLNGTHTKPVADMLARLDVPFLFSTGYSDTGMGPDHAHRPKLTKPFKLKSLAEGLTAMFLQAPK